MQENRAAFPLHDWRIIETDDDDNVIGIIIAPQTFMERGIGQADQSVVIARRAKKLNRRPAVQEVFLVEPLYRLALGIFRDSLRAFIDGDSELALRLKPRDRELDGLNAELNDRLTERMGLNPEQVPSFLDIIFIARALERIGDHATNIAEDAFWQAQAEDIRHTFGAVKEE